MTAQLMDGVALAADTLAQVSEGVAEFFAATGRRPCLVTVLVGDDATSHVYVRMKVNRSQKVGIESRRIDLPGTTPTAELVSVLEALSEDRSVDGILLQQAYVEVVFAAVFAWWLLGEHLGSAQLIGGVMVLVGAFISQRPPDPADPALVAHPELGPSIAANNRHPRPTSDSESSLSDGSRPFRVSGS